ncbi:hypothetical protein TSUD_288390 [Trifolium subterraneum]|uniref:Transposase-associated domain-containing protein n=1 Tax=Trifolium subterraneum TaxID=3900 RepID=A0A2Z6P1U9_TRISU|nr:hypothetical protein TSUD_288390 [Trifolium subterraneum]
MDDYYVWTHHGERELANINTEFNVNMDASSSGAQRECGNFGRMQDMVGDALGVNMSYEGGGEEAIIPNEKALKFYAMMEEVNKPLYEGASDSKLSMCVRLIAAKSNWNVPEDCLEFFSKMMLDATPIKDNLPTNYYDAKRLVSKLGLQVKKIDCCVQGCMLFYDNEFSTNDGALEECKFCIKKSHNIKKRHNIRLCIGNDENTLKMLEPNTETAKAIRIAIRAVYKKIYPTATRLRDMLYDAREAYKVRHDPPKNPYWQKWIGEEVWKDLLDYWETDPTFIKRSEANKGNRKSSKGGCLHTMGSVSVFTHAQELKRTKGNGIDIDVIHKETHTKKSTGAYVDLRSENTQRLYWDKIGKFLQEHPEYSCHDAIPNTIRREIWLDRDVAGPGTYGFGKLAPNVRNEDLLHVPTPEERYHLLAFPPTAQAEIQRLTQESQTQREEINRLVQKDQEREQMMHEELRKLREEQKQAMEQQKMEMTAYLKKMVASSFRNAPIDETAPHEDSTNSNNEDTNTEDSANSNNEDTITNDAN